MKTTLKAPGSKLLKLENEKLISNFAFNFNLRHYYLVGQKESVYCLAMDAAGTLLVSGCTQNIVRLWDTRTAEKRVKLKGHTGNVRCAAIDPTGRMCITASSDHTLRLWDLGHGLTLVHFSAKIESFLTQNTPATAPETALLPPDTSQTPPKQSLNAPLSHRMRLS
jgi:WD40 repeat protein